jgi:predicted metal-dependent HD superfamily phosphohydrolase
MLQHTERFQKDVTQYTERISKMSDEKEKLEATRLLNDLIYEVKNMDNMYVDMVYAKQLASLGNEMKDKIGSIRKKLDQKLKNC